MPVSSVLEGVIFDLDDTLVSSSHLKDARRQGNRAAVEAGLTKLAVDPEVRKAVAIVAAILPVAIVTTSPAWYAQAVLEHALPEVEWDAVVTANDAARAKPYPDGLQLAAERLGLKDLRAVAYVGDTRDDMEAAYHAGMRPVLCRWFSRDTEAKRLCPDAVLYEGGELLDYLGEPVEFLPIVEQGIADPTCQTWHPRKLKLPLEQGTLRVQVLGRYFPREGETLALHESHDLSKQIARKAEAPPFVIPSSWIDALTTVTLDLVEEKQINLVTVIPAKPGRDNRLERFLGKLEAAVRATDFGAPDFRTDLLSFGDDARTVKNQSPGERFAEVEKTLQRRRPCLGARVMLIDDVVTVGGTLSVASDLLMTGGAADVRCVAVAKTISSYLFSVSTEDKRCPNCGRAMVKRVRKRDGVPFYGCTGYPDHCQCTESI